MFNEFDCPHPARLSHLIFGGIFTVIAVLSISCGGESSSNSPIDIPDSETTISSSETTNSSSFDEGCKCEAMSSNEIIEVSSSSEKPVSSSSLSTEKSPYSSSEVKSSSSFKKNENSSSSSLIGESSSSLQIEEYSSSSFYEKKWDFLNPKIVYGEIVDKRDGQKYKTVEIGSQVWMAENLNYDFGLYHYEEFQSSVFCEDDENCRKYGRYYTWAMAIDSAALRKQGLKCGDGYECSFNGPIQGICPEGFHLPDTTEWLTLKNYVFEQTGDSSSAALKATTDWIEYEDEETHQKISLGNDLFGFSALPSGHYEKGVRNWYFSRIGKQAAFWSSTHGSGTFAGGFNISYDSERIFYKSKAAKSNYFPIRCIKD
jgi:uncharacterized protein (TIGR02145 family)